MVDSTDMVQAIADGLTLAQTADRFCVSVDEVREAQKQALAAFSDGDALRLDWMLESKRLAACAGFKSLGEPWADTTTSAGRLMLTVLSGIAEFERDLILQRTNEGRVRALAEGVRFGRKPKLTKHQAREALKRVAAGEPLRETALSYDVDHSTISRLKARYAAEV